MNTLSNVETRGGETHPPSISLIPDAIPEAKSSKTGVSVSYVPTSDKNWYVFRASYGRVDKASDFLVEDGTYVYIAKRYTLKVIQGKRKRFLVPLIPNLLFAYTTFEKAEEYAKHTPALSFLSYYYNHLTRNEEQKNPPLTISSKEMENFILATCNMDEHLMFVKEEQCHYKGGETVHIVDGQFKGVEGRVARVAGQQRVVITISNVGLVSTAYVPSAFIKIINET